MAWYKVPRPWEEAATKRELARMGFGGGNMVAMTAVPQRQMNVDASDAFVLSFMPNGSDPEDGRTKIIFISKREFLGTKDFRMVLPEGCTIIRRFEDTINRRICVEVNHPSFPVVFDAEVIPTWDGEMIWEKGVLRCTLAEAKEDRPIRKILVDS